MQDRLAGHLAGAKNTNPTINGIAQAIRQGTSYTALIGATDGKGTIVTIEGNHRASAYAITNAPASVIIGTSNHMTTWHYW